MQQKLKLHQNALHPDGHFLICMKPIGVILPYYTHSEHNYVSRPPLKIQWAIGEWQGQDKRRRDCNKNSIIWSQTDIILLLAQVRRRDSKAAFSPALHMDLIDHNPSSRDSAEMLSELQHDHPWCLYIIPLSWMWEVCVAERYGWSA